MPIRLPAAERRRQLLDVALTEFAERGYAGVSMDSVAEAAGVTKPVLYQHFESKRALYSELLDDVGARIEAAVVKATANETTPRGQVEAGFRVYFRLMNEDQAAFRLMFSTDRFDADLTESIAKSEASFATTIAALINVEGLSSDDRLLLAHGIVGIAEVTSRHFKPGERNPDELAAKVATLAWAGLRGLT